MTAGAVAVPTIIPIRNPLVARTKSNIDSNTKIEIRSDTPNTDIYYTINGSKPEPFKRIGERVTMPYRGPFTLPAGKQTVKAMAITKDGVKESNIVTKVFEVEHVPSPDRDPEDDEMGFQEQLENERAKLSVKRAQSKFLVSTHSAWTETDTMKHTQQMMTDMQVGGSGQRRGYPGTRYLNSRLGSTHGTELVQSVTSQDFMQQSSSDLKQSQRRLPDNTTQAMRLQRQTDFLKCIYCFSDRPSDPFARFCTTCGNPVPPIPQTRIAPPEPGQMGMCVYCKSVVPFNTTSCVVCEGPIPVQNQPHASIKLADRLVCTLCGTANPSNLVTCLTCNAKLPTTAQQKAIFSGLSAPPVSNPEKKYVRCNKCTRVNNGDARFCDWCGAKPSQATSALVCSQCGGSNHPYSTFCGSCGIKVDAPARTEYRLSSGSACDSKWLPVTFGPQAVKGTGAPKGVASIATQTVGLFYPSQREMDKRKEADDEKVTYEKQMRDRKPLLTAISPGRGYWRKQIDHICQHLKAHAQNDAEFRALIGEPKMGKLITSSIQEDGYELSLSLTFALRGSKDPFTGKRLGVSHQGYLSMHTEQDSMTSYRSDSEEDAVSESTSRPGTGKKKSGRKSRGKKKKPENKVSPIDQKLLKELGANAEGSAAEVQQLLDEGADCSCVNQAGLPALHVAVKNKHVDAIPVLIQAGADVNRKGPSSIKGNTALHEAVNLGPSGIHLVEVLLENGADQTKKNDRGETAYELATKAGFENITTVFAQALGQSQLKKMAKARAH